MDEIGTRGGGCEEWCPAGRCLSSQSSGCSLPELHRSDDVGREWMVVEEENVIPPCSTRFHPGYTHGRFRHTNGRVVVPESGCACEE